jgi:hypothetical protein
MQFFLLFPIPSTLEVVMQAASLILMTPSRTQELLAASNLPSSPGPTLIRAPARKTFLERHNKSRLIWVIPGGRPAILD